jgi:aminoglycoside phosphotransferase (APT) family kinase protein
MKKLLAEAFPGLIIHSLTRMGSGKSGEIFLANDEIVFKVALASDKSDSCLALEYDVLCALKGKMEITIPQPLYFGTLSNGRMVLGESLVPGIQFTQELYEEFTQSEKDALFAHMGEIFYQIHSANIPRIEKIAMYDYKENYFEDFHKYYTDNVKNTLTCAEQSQIQRIVGDFDAAIKTNPVPVVLCHGDLHFWNLNYDPITKKICGLLDFGLVCYNDPLNDMRYFWSDTVIKMLYTYPGDIGKDAAARHLFYCVCNIIEEAHGELESGTAGFYVDNLKNIIFQKPLPI